MFIQGLWDFVLKYVDDTQHSAAADNGCAAFCVHWADASHCCCAIGSQTSSACIRRHQQFAWVRAMASPTTSRLPRVDMQRDFLVCHGVPRNDSVSAQQSSSYDLTTWPLSRQAAPARAVR